MAWWYAGGAPMYVVLASAGLVGLLVVASLAAAIGAWFAPALRTVARVIGIGAVFATILPLLVGLVGWWYDRSIVDAAVRAVDPSQAQLIRLAGYSEARHPMDLGSGLTCALLVPAAIAGLVALTVPRRGDGGRSAS